MLCQLFAQVPQEIAGVTGWTSFGLVGLVLSWLLLKHLPDQEKSRKDERTEFTQTIKDTRSDFASLMREQQKVFADSLNKIVEHCRDEIREVVESLHGGGKVGK